MSTTKRRVALLATAGAAAVAIAVGTLVACSPTASTTTASPAPSSTATAASETCDLDTSPGRADDRLIDSTTDVSAALVTVVPSDLDAEYERHTLTVDSTYVYTQHGNRIGVIDRGLSWSPDTDQPIVTVESNDARVEPVEQCDALVPILVPSRVVGGDAIASQSTGIVYIDRAALSEGDSRLRRAVVDRADTLTILDADGSKLFETSDIWLGREGDETPAVAAAYIVAQYEDPEGQPYIYGEVQLTSAHSTTSTFLGNNGPLAIHGVQDDTTGSSRGCIRLQSKADADRVAELLSPGDLFIVH